MAYEVLTAFFLEAGFLGVMLFGMNRVGKGLHFTATLMVAFGTFLSAFSILLLNSWMHAHRLGHERRRPVHFGGELAGHHFQPPVFHTGWPTPCRLRTSPPPSSAAAWAPGNWSRTGPTTPVAAAAPNALVSV